MGAVPDPATRPAHLAKAELEMVRLNGLHMLTAADSGVAAPSSPRYLRTRKGA